MEWKKKFMLTLLRDGMEKTIHDVQSQAKTWLKDFFKEKKVVEKKNFYAMRSSMIRSFRFILLAFFSRVLDNK